MSKVVIAIDGPAGAGKSTVSKMLALRLGLRYLDTGAMYRALALKAHRLHLADGTGEAIANLMETTEIAFGAGDPQPILLDGEDVTAQIRTPAISDVASRISTLPEVRRALVTLQQRLVAAGGVILEGRDTTTVVAPNANLRVYMTASLEERARRRAVEFAAKGQEAEYDAVRTDIETRDYRDITRAESPLKVAPGAVLIETAGLSPAEVVERIVALLPE